MHLFPSSPSDKERDPGEVRGLSTFTQTWAWVAALDITRLHALFAWHWLMCGGVFFSCWAVCSHVLCSQATRTKATVGHGMLGLLSDGAGEGLVGSKLRATQGQGCLMWFVLTAQPGSATHQGGPFRLKMLHL